MAARWLTHVSELELKLQLYPTVCIGSVEAWRGLAKIFFAMATCYAGSTGRIWPLAVGGHAFSKRGEIVKI
jgi:hypothetical protein